MTLMDVEIGHARPARSPDKKAARDYLIASGASAISVIDNETGCTFATGKLNPRAAVVFWLPDGEARAVVKLARRAAGKKPDIAAATSALQRAAADQRVTLTTHDVAMTRQGTRSSGSTAISRRCAGAASSRSSTSNTSGTAWRQVCAARASCHLRRRWRGCGPR